MVWISFCSSVFFCGRDDFAYGLLCKNVVYVNTERETSLDDLSAAVTKIGFEMRSKNDEL